MELTLKKTYTTLFWLGVFFIPFNSYIGISFLGEYAQEGAIVFFLFSFGFYILDILFKNKVILPYKNSYFQLLLLFILWLLLATVLNGSSVLDNFMKQTSGYARFLRQMISFFMALIPFILGHNIIHKKSIKELFYQFRKVLSYSFFFVAFYAVFEILILIFDIDQLKGVFQLFDFVPFVETNLDETFKRISSVSFEPPFLAIYLITSAGWMFSYIVSSRKIARFLPTLMIFVLTFYSGSRTALIVVTFQFIIFLIALFVLSKKYRLLIERLFIGLVSISLLVLVLNGKTVLNAVEKKVDSLNFTENLSDNISNRSRFGIQYTSILIFKENPILGVGFGQQAYSARSLYPQWATKKNYEFELWYLNDQVRSFPPGFNMYTRLLAETGLIGFLLFLTLLGSLIYQSAKWVRSKKNEEKTLSIVLLISFIGFFINWLQFDSFRVFGFWICFAIFLKLLQQNKSYE